MLPVNSEDVTGIAIIWLIVPIPLIVRIVEVKTANL